MQTGSAITGDETSGLASAWLGGNQIDPDQVPGTVAIAGGGYAAVDTDHGALSLPVLVRPGARFEGDQATLTVSVPCPPDGPVVLKDAWVVYWTET
jgi:hypothetical protein